jgi:hypothetical protein
LSNPYLKSLINTKKLQNINNNNVNNIRIKSANDIKPEKEKLYDECIKLKSNLNNLNKELAHLKSEVFKKDLEINKKNKMIQDFLFQNEIYSNNINNEKIIVKMRENNLVANLKKVHKELKKELTDKENELENIKKKMKNTKINEMQIELKLNQDMINNMSNKMEIFSQKYNKQEKDLITSHEIMKKQKELIKQLKEQLEKKNLNNNNVQNNKDENFKDQYNKELE